MNISKLWHFIDTLLEPEYFNSIKEAKLGSKQVTTNSDEGGSSTHAEYYFRFVSHDNKISYSVFRSADSDRLALIKHQINSFIKSQQSSLVITEEIGRIPNEIETIFISFAFLGTVFGLPTLVVLLAVSDNDRIVNRIVSNYFVFDKYSQKLEHTVKIFNWSFQFILTICLVVNVINSFGAYLPRLPQNYDVGKICNCFEKYTIKMPYSCCFI